MNHFDWQLKKPIDAVVFDCDSTLSQIEGIDFIAGKIGKAKQVHHLTERAMAMEGIGPSLYNERLELVRPKLSDIHALVEDYYYHLTPDVLVLIQVLQKLGKTVYIISAGIHQAVVLFAKLLGIEEQYVFAVDLHFSEQGEYQGFDENSPMVHYAGKKKVVSTIKQQDSRIAHIGDGMNDLEALSEAARFVGYGGACFREDIMQCCPFYITEKSLAASLPLLLTATETQQLTTQAKKLHQKGLDIISNGGVVINAHHHAYLM